MSRYHLRLYVSGESPRTQRALANLAELCQTEMGGAVEIEVVDVLERPDLAETDRIMATPTLVKRLPPPVRRVIGDLTDAEKVLVGLDVWPLDADDTTDEPGCGGELHPEGGSDGSDA